MTDANIFATSGLGDEPDGEALDTCLDSMKQDVANLQESHRKRNNKAKQAIAKLYESREKCRREYSRELALRQKTTMLGGISSHARAVI